MSESADIKELAVATWRLSKWLDNLNSERKIAAKSSLRSIKKYVEACGVTVSDPVGSKFDPGLAVEVVNNEAPDVDETELIIIETITPYVYQDGRLLQHARVIIGTEIKEQKENNEIVTNEVSNEKTSSVDSAVEDKKAHGDESGDLQIDKKDIERVMKYAKIL